MHEVAVRWKVGDFKWSPWHWRPVPFGPTLCGQAPAWGTRETTLADPYEVTCEPCKAHPGCAEAKQKYDLLVTDVEKVNLNPIKDGSSLVVPACNIANKHSTTFDVAYGLLTVRFAKYLKPKREPTPRGQSVKQEAPKPAPAPKPEVAKQGSLL